MRQLFILYVLTLSFTSGFQLFVFIAIPLLVAGVACCGLLVRSLDRGTISGGVFQVEDLALGAFLVVGEVDPKIGAGV
jgi:hypothetical protein